MGQLAIEKEINLRQYSYHGLVLPDKDPKNQGRYKIHIPELHPLIKAAEGIWVKNQQHNWRYGPSDDYMYGEYFPLQPGTKVLVKFYENDFHTGYVDRIISDQIISTTPKIAVKKIPKATTDRDDIYMLFKTPKKHNLFTVLEDTADSTNKLNAKLIPNSMHLYYNYRRSTMIINQDGIHWFTMDNRGVTVEGNNSEWVNKNEKVYVKLNRDVFINGNHKHHTHLDYDSTIDGEHREHSCAQHSTTSSTRITEDAPTIWMNSGLSHSAKMAVVNKGEDEIIKQNKIDMRVVAHQYRDTEGDTYYGDTSIPIVGGTPPDNGKGDPKKNRLPVGMNDRHSSIGAQQTGANNRYFPPYPSSIGGCGTSIPSSWNSVANKLNLTPSNIAGATGGMQASLQKIAKQGSVPGMNEFLSSSAVAESGSIGGLNEGSLSSAITVDPSEYASTLPKSNTDCCPTNTLGQLGGENPAEHITLAEKLGTNNISNALTSGGLPSAFKDSQQSILSNLGGIYNTTGENPLTSRGDPFSSVGQFSDYTKGLSLQDMTGSGKLPNAVSGSNSNMFGYFPEALDLDPGVSLTNRISDTILNGYSGGLTGNAVDALSNVGLAAGLGDLKNGIITSSGANYNAGLDPFSSGATMNYTGEAFGNSIDIGLNGCIGDGIDLALSDFGLSDLIDGLADGLSSLLSGLTKLDDLLCATLGPLGLGAVSDAIAPALTGDIESMANAGISNTNAASNVLTSGIYDLTNQSFSTGMSDALSSISDGMGPFGSLLCGGSGFPGLGGLDGCANNYPNSNPWDFFSGGSEEQTSDELPSLPDGQIWV